MLTDHIEHLRQAFRHVRLHHPFSIDALVVLPDHLHALWTLPPEDRDFATRWRLIKSTFSRGIPGTESRSASRRAKGERAIWQRRYWEHTVRDAADYGRHIDYIHFNPVKHGHAKAVRDWPYSSFHRFVRQGLLPCDWAGVASAEGEREEQFGERRTTEA